MAYQQCDVLPVQSKIKSTYGPKYDGSELSCPSPVVLPSDPLPEPSYSNDVSTKRRARELYKYFHPQEFESSLKDDKTADLLLTSQAQLIALKLGGKCLINFLDNSKQFIVAEANGPSALLTRRGSAEGLVLEEQFEEVQWVNCRGSDIIQNSVCRMTIEAPYPDHAGPMPFFEVEDLRNDERFSSIPLVTSPPHLRYYAGTPLFTQSGIAIGAFVLVDNKARGLMSDDDKFFLHKTAKNVMRLLELTLQSREQSRLVHMNACMSRFINSGNTSQASSQFSPSSSLAARRHAFHKRSSRFDDDISGHQFNTLRPRTKDTADVPMCEESLRIDSNIRNDVKDGKHSAGEHDPKQHDPLRQSANLLREALGSESCGVVILDSMNLTTSSPEIKSAGLSRDARPEHHSDGSRSPLSPGRPVQDMKDSPRPTTANATTFKFESNGPCPVLASSISKRSDPALGGFVPPSIETMTDLLRRYPSGHLWIYDSDGEVCRGDDADPSANHRQIRLDGQLLSKHVKQASCLLMKPIWNARLDREVVALIYSTTQYHLFTTEQDLPFINAFCNCVAMELHRLATMAADEQKSDFLGTISHELRSPLHGILASCEILMETHLSASQQEAVTTIDGCSRTLHDTITMVLDWSKVNAFERDWRTVCADRRAAAASGRDKPKLPQSRLLPNLYGNVDLAAALREVVKASVISHGRHEALEVNFADLSGYTGGREHDSSLCEKERVKGTQPDSQPQPPVKVLVEVSEATKSWIYVTQPGAFRRVIMNLVGNGLKYTKKGHVKVSLRSTASAATLERRDIGVAYDTIILEVEDTGKGISAEWLRTKAFTPFTQEDPLAAGTGLGLSLTKSIVDMLEGTMNISSAVGKGTTVRVSIPMPPHEAALSSQNETSFTAETAAGTVDNPPFESLAQSNALPPSTSEFPFPGTGQESGVATAEKVSSITPTESAVLIDKSHLILALPPGPVRSMTDTAPTASQLTPRSARILLVDDNAINLRLLSQYMSKLQYTNVTTACDGRIAADTFKAALDSSTQHQLIFMDLNMPVLDGFDATREIRAQEREYWQRQPALSNPCPAYIVALTGLASEKDRNRAFEAGVDLYMTKPASFKEVSKMMKTWEAQQ